MALVLLLLLPVFISATNIATFSDDLCQDSYRDLNGPNGYPNGTCTRLDSDGPLKSFQLVEEDNGCAVTIYGQDTTEDSCSATDVTIAEIAQCYNASWVYYSIDECISPASNGSMESSSSSISSTSMSSTSVSSVTTASITISSSSTSSPTSRSTAHSSTAAIATTIVTVSSQPTNASSSTTPVGAIVGGVVGGVAALALICLLAFLLLRRQHRRPALRSEAHGESIHEVPGQSHALELPLMQKRAELESLHSDRYARSLNAAPLELEGNRYELKGNK